MRQKRGISMKKIQLVTRSIIALAIAIPAYLSITVGQAQEPITPITRESDEVRVSCKGGSTRVCVFIPSDAQLVHSEFLMRNSSWAGGGLPCRSDIGSTSFGTCRPGGECSVGWSRVQSIEENSDSVCATFYNWKHDNHRWGKIRVRYR